jgi:hypothetical protein
MLLTSPPLASTDTEGCRTRHAAPDRPKGGPASLPTHVSPLNPTCEIRHIGTQTPMLD